VIPLELRVLSLTLLAALLLWLVWLIRRGRLSVQDSLLWLVSTILAILAAVFPSLLEAASQAIGVKVPSNALFAAGLAYLAVNVLHLTITSSTNSAHVRRLVQESALLRAEVERLVAPPSSAPADGVTVGRTGLPGEPTRKGTTSS
jgi:hypothetical protein